MQMAFSTNKVANGRAKNMAIPSFTDAPKRHWDEKKYQTLVLSTIKN